MSTFTRRGAMALMGATAATPFIARTARAQTPINVGALRFTSHAPSFIAAERGYFADAGLDVNFEFFQAAQPMAIAIASGDADYGVTAVTGGLISLAQKGAAKVIGGGLSEEPGIDGQKILASNDAYEAGLTDPSKLDGKTYGITQAGSSFHYMGSKIAQAEGAEVSFKPLQKVPAVIGAIKTGQIDAWSIVPHIAKPLANAGAVKIIGDVSDYLPNYQVTTVFTSADNAANKREQTAAFLEAFSRGAADFNAALVDNTADEAERDAIIELIAGYVYPDRSVEEARPSIVNGAMRINANAALNRASVQDQLDWFKSEGLVGGDVAYDTLVDESYVDVIS
ncbi:ABC transporter substrate-binding protein [Tranquillimonas alkanivorans]|uniref:NitT/TauT family transport system substrate-binding protein n=1 Tax=Tranquillimonas alkanivorans TaxID=441119 RepID=A0A1I5T379_9RHOB|nr:ABC transporter substrate-binding protein [Tranquillimonas alkanivorans]SFP77418.1 NitT/TauT family transport system substrate-binding protein [Tranquillimonas alkanivorans]